ncbi:hypothetical protein LPJ60_002493 [Coemansia sp. RSA 2675]|uniref:Uncharacterized protein n=1 Tax=Coemansia linderi TaxID=2663919 RepID=A0ACC1KLI1_9FUNG|nr:hypothetical protein LPJ60_002493 [Coemansia sp. RSA 2675]KAJ2791478.1 hypothetical protein GGI18_001108 [Coemansia linderi]
MAGGFLRWRNYVDKLMRFNHMTMTLGAERFRVADSGAQTLRYSRRETPHEQRFASQSVHATATIQYAFDCTSNFPQPFLSELPRFDSSFDPSLRHLPCILFLHGNDPGGFDVARWMAAGISHVHQLRNPLMPGQFESFTEYGVKERMNLNTDTGEHDIRAPPYARLEHEGSSNRPHSSESQIRFRAPMPPLSLLSLSRPGYLESSSSPAPTFLAHATAAAQLVENLRVPSIHIVAHKVAAPIALEMAGMAGFRNRIRSITLIDPQLTAPGRTQRLAERLSMLGPEWARTRAAYNALARAASDDYFRQAISEMCGPESLLELQDDPGMAQLYERIGVFFTHWNSRKPGVLADILMWDKLDRRNWGLVKAPILCVTGSTQPYSQENYKLDKADQAREEAARAALVSTRSKPEFVHMYGSGRVLFPLSRASKLCLDFIYRHLA